jgi:predicted transcriptional regulator
MAARFKKIIDPKVLAEDDKSPELQSAEQMIEALTQQLNQTMGMVENIQNSMEAQELQIKAYDAETKRISAVQNAMTPDQIQDIVMGTIAAAIETGDISNGRPLTAETEGPRGSVGMPELPAGANGPVGPIGDMNA